MSCIRSGGSLMATCSRHHTTRGLKIIKQTTNRCRRNMNHSCESVHNVVACVALVFVIQCTLLTHYLALASPPIDYFIYTSQMRSSGAHREASGDTSAHFLPQLATIYQVRPDLDKMSSIVSNRVSEPSAQDIANMQDDKSREMAKRVLALVQNTSHTHDNNQIDLETTQYAWLLMEQQARAYMKNRMLMMRPIIEELLLDAKVSTECHAAMSHWLDELSKLKQWALLMWNSWGNFPPAGLYEGSFTDLGSYRSCMSIDEDALYHGDGPDNKPQAQYCMFDFQPLVPTRPRFHSIYKRVLAHNDTTSLLTGGDYKLPLGDKISSRHTSHGFGSSRFVSAPKAVQLSRAPIGLSNSSNQSSQQRATIGAGAIEDSTLDTRANYTLNSEAFINLALKAQYFYYVKFRIGGCLPTKCSRKDAKKLAETASQRAILQSSQVNCMTKEPTPVNTHQLVAIIILTLLALVAVLGTVVDLLGIEANKPNQSALIEWLLLFSIYTNAKRLFDFETAGTHGNLECVHGLRFFSMLWVVYGHTILYTEYQSFTHFYDVVERQIPSFALLPTLNANFSVDTFFVISGILTTYVTWEYTKGDARKFNKFAFLISRYIRLTPQLAIVILCFFLLPLFGTGPMYHQVADKEAEACYKNWAINLLYLQSFVTEGRLCIDPSWWLSNEMAFHVISLVVIVVMIQNATRGMMVNFAIALVLTVWGAIIHYTNGFAIQYLPSIPQRYEIVSEQTTWFFHRPYPHAASYFIGIALGYVLANDTVKKMTRAQIVQGWTVCAVSIFVSLWGSYYWNLGAAYTQLQATLYYNLCQVLWPIAISWIILACSLGYGGYVNSILSARCFVPLGRVTYMTYLSHALIIYYHSASMHLPVEPSMLMFTYLFIANTTLALILGVALTIVYESPILNLQKQLFTYLTEKFDPTNGPDTNRQSQRTAPGQQSTRQTANGIYYHSVPPKLHPNEQTTIENLLSNGDADNYDQAATVTTDFVTVKQQLQQANGHL